MVPWPVSSEISTIVGELFRGGGTMLSTVTRNVLTAFGLKSRRVVRALRSV
jgi:hypothetical protein